MQDGDACAKSFLSTFIRPDLSQTGIQAIHLETLEFEARLCTPTNGTRGGVNTNIPVVHYERMKTAMKTLTKHEPVYTEHIVERYGHTNDNITSSRAESEYTFRHKKKLGTLDMAATGTPFDIRLAASLELPVRNNPTSADVTSRLMKRRWSFTIGKNLRVDFTRLEFLSSNDERRVTSQTPDDEYQVEIEIVDSHAAMRSGVSPDAIWTQMKELIAYLAEACDMQRNVVTYRFIKKRLY